MLPSGFMRGYSLCFCLDLLLMPKALEGIGLWTTLHSLTHFEVQWSSGPNEVA